MAGNYLKYRPSSKRRSLHGSVVHGFINADRQRTDSRPAESAWRLEGQAAPTARRARQTRWHGGYASTTERPQIVRKPPIAKKFPRSHDRTPSNHTRGGKTC